MVLDNEELLSASAAPSVTVVAAFTTPATTFAAAASSCNSMDTTTHHQDDDDGGSYAQLPPPGHRFGLPPPPTMFVSEAEASSVATFLTEPSSSTSPTLHQQQQPRPMMHPPPRSRPTAATSTGNSVVTAAATTGRSSEQLQPRPLHDFSILGTPSFEHHQNHGLMTGSSVQMQPVQQQQEPPAFRAQQQEQQEQKRPKLFTAAVERPRQTSFPATVSLSSDGSVPEPVRGAVLVPPPLLPPRGGEDGHQLLRFQNNAPHGVSALNVDYHAPSVLHYQEEPARQYQQQQQQSQSQHQSDQQQQQQQQVKYNCVPKGELHSLYGKAPRRKIISAENYHTWHDAGQAHMLKWTSVFVCPLTGELFRSGRYLGATATTATAAPATSSSLLWWWFVKKTAAEHGAAARAYDCLVYRDHAKSAALARGLLSLPVMTTIGLEKPYLENQAMRALPEAGVPPDVRQRIQAQQEEIRRMNGLGGDGYLP